MMDYMGRLRETVSEKQPSHQPTKHTEPGFVGFAGSPSSPFPLPDDIRTGVDRLKVMRPPLSLPRDLRSEEHTSEPQSLMRTTYAVFCMKKKTTTHKAQPSAYIPISRIQ